MKKLGKRVAAAGMAMSLVAGLCACGGGGDSKENAALAKENVYKLQEFELPDLGGDDYNVMSTYRQDGTSYIMVQVYDWSSAAVDRDIRLLAIEESTGETKLIPLEMPGTGPADTDGTDTDGTDTEDEDTGDGESDNSNPPNRPQPRDNEDGDAGTDDTDTDAGEDANDGDADAGEEGEDAVPDIGIDVGLPDTDMGGNDTWEYIGYNNFVFSGDGRIYGIKDHNFEDYNNEENSFQKQYICAWNLDGSFQWESELEDLRSDEEWIYVNTMVPGADGSLRLLLSGDACYLMQVSAQGEVSAREPLPDELTGMLTNAQNVFPGKDDTLLVSYSDENDRTKQYLNTFNLETGEVGEASELPSGFMWNYNNIMPGTNTDLIYCSSSGVYTYNRGDEEGKMMMSFINSDLNINGFVRFTPIDEKSFLGIFNENYEYRKLRAGIFTYVDPKDIPDKKVLVLAGNYVRGDLKKRIVEYNRSSQEYRIVVREYDSYSTYEDYNAGFTKLNNDIITGSMPDILVADGLPVGNYIAKGLIADIGKMIEKDEELSQVEFLQNVFDAYSVNGKLYYVVPSFYVRTMLAKKSLVGDRQQWTMEDMQQVLATMPEGAQAFGDQTREYFFDLVMQYCGSDFIDVATGKCSFDSPDFIAMMEFAKTLPEEITYDEDYWMNFNYESQYREDKVLLYDNGIGRISNMNYVINGYFGEEVSFVGFPTQSGNGSFVSSYDNTYCISSKSRNQEEAWNFLRYYLTDEYQKDGASGMPVKKDVFLEKAQEALERPYYLDENGEKQEYDETFYLNGEEIPLPPMTQEQIDQVVAFVQTVNKSVYTNEAVLNIIKEEMDAFYSGQKSAQDVAKIIQSRAQVYVDENR